MNNETIEQVKTLIAPVSEKLGQTAEFTYAVAKKQVYTDIAGSVILIIGILVMFLIAMKSKRVKPYTDALGSDFILIFGSMLLLFATYNAVKMAINPDWYAIQNILNAISQVR